MQVWQSMPENWARVFGPLRTLLEVALIMLLAVILARLVWLVASPVDSVAELEVRALPTLVSASGDTLMADRSLLVRSNPFVTEATSELVPDAPETKLNLRLAGLIMSTDAFGGSAQITTPDNQTRRYAIDAEVLPGVRLERVLSDRVILRRNGVSEALMLGDRGDGLTVIGNDSQVSIVQSSEGGSSPSTVEGRVGNPAALIQAMQPTPAERNGALYGYTLSLRGSAEALVATGLASGDVLREVNGIPVAGMDIAEMISEISAQKAVTLEVERDGEPLTINLVFEE